MGAGLKFAKRREGDERPRIQFQVRGLRGKIQKGRFDRFLVNSNIVVSIISYSVQMVKHDRDDTFSISGDV